MLCPVCKTECGEKEICPKCGFREVNRVFITVSEGEKWITSVVKPFREKYLKSINDFEIDGNVLIKYRGNNKRVAIPYGVEIIAPEAFARNKDISNVFFPNTVKSIGKSAFEMSSISNVEFSQGIEIIGSNAFESCAQLREIEIPSSCKIIKKRAFACCWELSLVKISDGVIVIEESAFFGCNKLKEIHIPASVQELQSGWCPTAVPVTVEIDKKNQCYCQIGRYTVVDIIRGIVVTGQLSDGIPKDNSITEIGDFAYSCNNNADRIVIPSNIRRVGNYSFSNNDSLKSIEISDGVMNIGDYAFNECKNLSKLIIPKTVIEIGRGALSTCSGNIKVFIDEKNIRFFTINECVVDFVEGVIISGCLKAGIPARKDITCIGERAFEEMETDVISIPRNITNIESNAFAGCNYKVCYIPKTVERVEWGAFFLCNLEENGRIETEFFEKPNLWDDSWDEACEAEVIWGSIYDRY